MSYQTEDEEELYSLRRKKQQVTYESSCNCYN